MPQLAWTMAESDPGSDPLLLPYHDDPHFITRLVSTEQVGEVVKVLHGLAIKLQLQDVASLESGAGSGTALSLFSSDDG